jgi:hypothetical protein
MKRVVGWSYDYDNKITGKRVCIFQIKQKYVGLISSVLTSGLRLVLQVLSGPQMSISSFYKA